MVLRADAVVDDLAVVVERLHASFADRAVPHGRCEEATASEAEVVDVAALNYRPR